MTSNFTAPGELKDMVSRSVWVRPLTFRKCWILLHCIKHSCHWPLWPFNPCQTIGWTLCEVNLKNAITLTLWWLDLFSSPWARTTIKMQTHMQLVSGRISSLSPKWIILMVETPPRTHGHMDTWTLPSKPKFSTSNCFWSGWGTSPIYGLFFLRNTLNI